MHFTAARRAPALRAPRSRSARCSSSPRADGCPCRVLARLRRAAARLRPRACRRCSCRRTSCSSRSCRRCSTRRRSSPACATSASNLRPISLLAFGLVAATTCGVAIVAHDAFDGISWASRVHARRDRLADRRARRDRGRPAAQRAAPGRLDHRRREPRQRRPGARPLQDRRRGRRRGLVLALGRVVAPRRERHRRHRASASPSATSSGRCGRRVDDTPTEVAIALLSGYLAYLPAAALGVSGVLAAVTIGVYMGWYTPQLTTVQTRLSGQRVLGDPRLPRQRAALRARRAPAARDRRPPARSPRR